MMMYFTLAIAVIAFFVLTFLNSSIFGAEPNLEDLKQSKNFRDGVFHNQSKTAVTREGASYTEIVKDLITKPKNNTPAKTIEVVKNDLSALNSTEPYFIWFGHSSYLLGIEGKTILVDPVFHNASPVPIFGKPFNYSHQYQAEDLPEIDVIVISHDHYDHLDEKAIKKLIPKTKHFITALGVDAHLKHWGIAAEKITTLDWEEHVDLNNFTFTAMPARHFSGRKFKRGNTLWCSFILKTPSLQIYLGGDSGYDNHFKNIGKNYGPFDLSILECGQYGKDWPNIHMLPEEMILAATELRTKKLIPVHWGKFSLAFHPWTEPIERALTAAVATDIIVFTPKIGEILKINEENFTEKWWRTH